MILNRRLRSIVMAAGILAGVVGTYVPGSAAAHQMGSHAVCGTPQPGSARCHSRLLTRDGRIVVNATPSGYAPSDLLSAYKLPASTTGAVQTVGIVDAYDDPSAVADVSTYRSQFSLGACRKGATAKGCTFTNGAIIRKLGQAGSTSYPRGNGGWAQEISLDLDMVSAICPACNIVLVEATTASLANLGAAVNTAINPRFGNANVVSNSYGGGESSSDIAYDTAYFNHPGHVITASSGDGGYGAGYPAASQYVTAVGGTSLSPASNSRGWSETAWSGAGSGCSAYDPNPTWQPLTTTGCATHRAESDVSAVADPSTGVAVYDSYAYQGVRGWLVFGGTSVASPIIASVYALAGNAASVTYGSYPYAHASSLNDMTSGSNGSCPATTALWCTAGPGWDGPTGLGTPNGLGAF